jgi:hypothetical protein
VEKTRKIWANETLCGMPVPELVGILRAAGFNAAEITARTGVPRGSIYRIAPAEKEPPAPPAEESVVLPPVPSPPLRENGVCPKCGAEKMNKSAPFCWNCGADIRNPAIILAERLDDAIGDLSSIPNSRNDKAIKVMNDVMEYLKEETSCQS